MPIYVALQVFYDAMLAASCLVAFRFGGRPERQGAAIILIGSLATWLVERQPLFDWRDARQGLLLVDGLVLAALFALPLRSNRFWPLWVTAFQLIAVTTHVAILLQPHRVLQAYAIAQGFWAYPMLAMIVVASILCQPRARRNAGGKRDHELSAITPVHQPRRL